MKDKIMEIITSNELTSEIYENQDGCFRNIISNELMNCTEDNVLETAVNIMAIQCELYDILLNNIAQFGNQELVTKCNNDINIILSK